MIDYNQRNRIAQRFRLKPTTAAILHTLASGKTTSHGELVDQCCRSKSVGTKTIDVQICWLRRAIAPLEIRTIRNHGYVIEGESLAAIQEVMAHD